ncbi:unnamed protein product [Lymnaea stagnalis]|uniref:Nucleoplasmin core domain-containing protein n=1 Tax=Lymnaea stagnalis TaxID=6523 RepID=A0AAV2H7J9_LYMST
MANRSRNMSEKSDTKTAIGVADMEYFWCAELNSSTRSVTWVMNSGDLDDDEDDDDYIEHSLFIKQAVLGSGAVSNEQNIITLESVNANGELKKGVVANLTRGSSVMAHLDFTISGKNGVTLTLAEGSGPVFLSGNHLLEYPKDDNLGDLSQIESDGSNLDEEEEDVEDEEEEEDTNKKTVKRKAAVKPQKPKKAKMDVVEDDDDEDEEGEDDEEDEDDEDYDFEENK